MLVSQTSFLVQNEETSSWTLGANQWALHWWLKQWDAFWYQLSQNICIDVKTLFKIQQYPCQSIQLLKLFSFIPWSTQPAPLAPLLGAAKAPRQAGGGREEESRDHEAPELTPGPVNSGWVMRGLL